MVLWNWVVVVAKLSQREFSTCFVIDFICVDDSRGLRCER